MPPSCRLEPASSFRSSTLEVEFCEVLELEGFGQIALVVLLLLGSFLLAELVVLLTCQAIRDVSVRPNGSSLDL